MNKKGFTLAELLIVVAIIAVLVGISIPIFTSQLEKSREATDLANIRSAYAQVMECAMSSEETPTGDVQYNNGRYSMTVNLVQKNEDWQTKKPLNIAGILSTDSLHWIGIPKENGTCTVSYVVSTNELSFSFGLDFLPIFSMTQSGNSSYKGNSVAQLLNDRNFTRLESSGSTGYYYLEDVKQQLNFSDSKEFSYLITKGDAPGQYRFYISTDYTLKRNTKQTTTMTVTGYLFDYNTNTILKEGTPQVVQTYINTSNQEKIDDASYDWNK